MLPDDKKGRKKRGKYNTKGEKRRKRKVKWHLYKFLIALTLIFTSISELFNRPRISEKLALVFVTSIRKISKNGWGGPTNSTTS